MKPSEEEMKKMMEKMKEEAKEQAIEGKIEQEVEFVYTLEIKIFKLIAYLEILRERIGCQNETSQLNNWYHSLGNVRYDLKKMLGHSLVTQSYVVKGDEL